MDPVFARKYHVGEQFGIVAELPRDQLDLQTHNITSSHSLLQLSEGGLMNTDMGNKGWINHLSSCRGAAGS